MRDTICIRWFKKSAVEPGVLKGIVYVLWNIMSASDMCCEIYCLLHLGPMRYNISWREDDSKKIQSESRTLHPNQYEWYCVAYSSINVTWGSQIGVIILGLPIPQVSYVRFQFKISCEWTVVCYQMWLTFYYMILQLTLNEISYGLHCLE